MAATSQRSKQICAIFLLCFSLGAKKAARSDGGPRQYLDEPAEWYSSDEAKDVSKNVLSYQSTLGGWPKNVDTTAEISVKPADKIKPTFDNNATLDEIRLLARMYVATRDPADKQAVERGIGYVLKAQYPSGGWPQSYPPDDSYHQFITFNDGAMVRILAFLREVAQADSFAFVEPKLRQSAQKAFDLGIDCILKCQIKVDGKLTVWCAQHDEVDYSPRQGRAFELISLSGSESVGITELLMSIDNPSPQIVTAVKSAVAWFESAELKGIKVVEQPAPGTRKGKDRVVVQDPQAPPMWARFYDLKTQKPIFCDRDGTPKSNLADIGYERRNGYRWLYYWPQNLLETEYPAWEKKWAGQVVTTQPGGSTRR